MRLNLCWVILLLLAGCETQSDRPSRTIPIDQVPMYGGLDRQSDPRLKEADETLVRDAASAFGSREAAAAAWISQGFRYYKSDDLVKAMRRFNQAWLLDPKNPEVYWGFGGVLQDQGKASQAVEMLEKAYSLGFRNAGFLADFGRASVLRLNEKPASSHEQRAQFIEMSERLFAQAIQQGSERHYVYETWGWAKYFQDDYPAAAEMIQKAREAGGEPSPNLVRLVKQKLP